jgi:hypothetical protein
VLTAVTVTGSLSQRPGDPTLYGQAEFTLQRTLRDEGDNVVVPRMMIPAPLVGNEFTIQLWATEGIGVRPFGTPYTCQIKAGLEGQPFEVIDEFSFILDDALAPTVDISDLERLEEVIPPLTEWPAHVQNHELHGGFKEVGYDELSTTLIVNSGGLIDTGMDFTLQATDRPILLETGCNVVGHNTQNAWISMNLVRSADGFEYVRTAVPIPGGFNSVFGRRRIPFLEETTAFKVRALTNIGQGTLNAAEVPGTGGYRTWFQAFEVAK